MGDDGGSNSVTVDGTTINYDNTNSASLADADTGYVLAGFDVSTGNRLWCRIELDNADNLDTAELTEAVDVVSPLEISGAVTLSGAGVSGARVYVIDTDAGEVAETATTDANGDYSVSVSSGPVYHVAVQYDDGSTQYNALSKPFVE